MPQYLIKIGKLYDYIKKERTKADKEKNSDDYNNGYFIACNTIMHHIEKKYPKLFK